MKRYGNLYEKVYDIENLRLAHRNARKNKAYYKEVKLVNNNEDEMLKQIQQMLVDKTYKLPCSENLHVKFKKEVKHH